MTKISEIREQLETLITTALTGYRQIPNPYEIEKTSNVILRKGFGIAFGPGTNTERMLSCQLSVDRDFSILLTREVAVTEHDAAGREAVEKSIFEDLHLLIKAIETDADLATKASRARYVSDNGLEYVGLENSRYFLIAATFAAEYFESIS